MMGGNKPESGGARFRETHRLQEQRAEQSSATLTTQAEQSEGETSAEAEPRGEDKEFSQDLSFAANIINKGVA